MIAVEYGSYSDECKPISATKNTKRENECLYTWRHKSSYLISSQFNAGVGNDSNQVNHIATEEATDAQLPVDLGSTVCHRGVLPCLSEAHPSLEDLVSW